MRAKSFLKQGAVLGAATALDTAIGRFLSDLADTAPSRELLDKIANRQARNNLLQSIHESLAELAPLIAVPFETPGMASLSANLTEGLAGLLMVAADAVRSDDPDELALLRKLTADRDSLVDQLRRRVIAADKELSVRDQHRLYTVTNLFERIVWMLRRYGNLLAVDVESVQATEAGSFARRKRRHPVLKPEIGVGLAQRLQDRADGNGGSSAARRLQGRWGKCCLTIGN